MAAVLGAGLVGSLLLLVAEFTTLFQVHASTSATAIRSVRTGSHHSYAMALIGVGGAILTLAFARAGSRLALPALGLLGVTALLIALLGDLADATATGILGSSATRFVSASATPGTGLYLETAGAIVLIIASGTGLLLLGPPARAPRSAS